MPLSKLRGQSGKEIVEITIFRIDFEIEVITIAQEV